MTASCQQSSPKTVDTRQVHQSQSRKSSNAELEKSASGGRLGYKAVRSGVIVGDASGAGVAGITDSEGGVAIGVANVPCARPTSTLSTEFFRLVGDVAA